MTPQAHHAAVVDELLLDAGFAQDAELRRVLLSVGSLADLPVPAPSGELAALLAGSAVVTAARAAGQAEGNAGDELAKRRGLRAHRPTVIGLALVAGMGMGVGTVAASSSGPVQAGSPSIQHLLEDWAPAWTIRTPHAAAPGFLQADNGDGGIDVRGQGGEGLGGSEAALAEDPPLTLQQSHRSRPLLAPQPAGQGPVRSGEPAAAGGQDSGRESAGQGGVKEPAKGGAAAGLDRSAEPAKQDQSLRAGERDGENRAAAGETEQDTAPAAELSAESAPEAGGQGAGGAGANPAPGAKWLEKFVR
ncbi:MAG: hypothetical protein ACLGIS_15680 [Actinomycetes bacterium]